MIRRAVGVVSVLVFLISCSWNKKDLPGWDVIVSGKVGFPREGNITIKNWNDTTDNVQVLDFDRNSNTYKSTVRVTEPGYYRINFFEMQYVDVILFKNDLQVNADGNNQEGFFEVIGSPDVELFKSIQSIRSGFQSSTVLSKLNEDFQDAVVAKNDKRIEALQLQYMDLLKESNDRIAKLLIEGSPSAGAIDFLGKKELDPDIYMPVYDSVAETLKGDWANYEVSRKFIDMVSSMKRLAIGSVAPEITLPDQAGNVVKLSSLRGKYVLVDFWAKWCGPCRKENPNVVKAYHRFKEKGFEVFGVSLDRSKNDWLQAISEDGLVWTQVLDLNSGSTVTQTYNIQAIPFSILLDPNGIIIAKNLRGSALERKLEEVF